MQTTREGDLLVLRAIDSGIGIAEADLPHVFDRLHRDVEAVAALTGMQGVFKLRSADIYRVLEIAQEPAAHRDCAG